MQLPVHSFLLSDIVIPKDLANMFDSGIVTLTKQNNTQSSTTSNPILCLILVVLSSTFLKLKFKRKGLLNIFYNYQTHQISNINGSAYSTQSCCYFVATLFYFIFNYFTGSQPLLFFTHLPTKNVFISLTICSFICMISMYYLHSLNNRYISERYTTKVMFVLSFH